MLLNVVAGSGYLAVFGVGTTAAGKPGIHAQVPSTQQPEVSYARYVDRVAIESDVCLLSARYVSLLADMRTRRTPLETLRSSTRDIESARYID